MIFLILTSTGCSRPGSFLLTQIAQDSFSREAGSGFVEGRIKSWAFLFGG